MNLGITGTHQFNAVVTGGQANTVDWYVAGIEGGNTTVGTITQGNPATYTAPDAIPTPALVLVRAVSTDDSTKSDSCQVTVTFDRIYVNSTTGHDTTGVGGRNKPYRSITKGLAEADPGMTVLAAPGVYDTTSGETFPISVPDSVVLEGENWETCIIRVDAEALNVRNAVRMGCDDCAIRKFTMEERGLEIVFNEDGNNTILRNLTVSGFSTGIEFNYMQNTLVENCYLSGNSRGANLCCRLDANSQPNPDFGGGARGGLGGNDFSGNPSCGLTNSTANVIYALNNTWGNTPPIPDTDFCNWDSANGGDVITQ
jgi:hypothetical protein